MHNKIKFITALLLLHFTSSFAQYPYTTRISIPDPLPTPIIYDMMADSKGYIWLATDKGLIRFNSRKFQLLPFENTSLKSVGYIQSAGPQAQLDRVGDACGGGLPGGWLARERAVVGPAVVGAFAGGFTAVGGSRVLQ